MTDKYGDTTLDPKYGQNIGTQYLIRSPQFLIKYRVPQIISNYVPQIIN